MSYDFEFGGDNGKALIVDAYTREAFVEVQRADYEGTGATFLAREMRQLRRFLEFCYPASEDPPHEPDPWEAR